MARNLRKSAKPISDPDSHAGRVHELTAGDIRAEHEAALAALSGPQRQALHRLRAAQQQSCFNHRWPSENLEHMFEAEAAQRNTLEKSSA